MLDFETPTYVSAKEAQHMQSQVNTLSVSSVFKMATNAEHLTLQASLSVWRLFSACYILICIVMPLVIYLDVLQLVGCPAIVYYYRMLKVWKNLLQCL